MSRYPESKSRRAYEATRSVTGHTGELTTSEKASLLSMEAFMDITTNAASGQLTTWYFVAKNYDADKDVMDQDDDFQYAMSMAIGSQVLLSTSLYAMGMSGLEFTVYKYAMTSAPKKALMTAGAPVIVPAASVYLADAYISAIGEYEPDGNIHDKSSFWSSVSAALSGTFGGIPNVGNY